MSTPEVYIITSQTTFRLSDATRVDVSAPTKALGDYFDHWGIRIHVSDNGSDVHEKFKTKDEAFAAMDIISKHLTGDVIILKHLRMTTLVQER